MRKNSVHTSASSIIRRACPDDAEALVDLVHQLAVHHGDRATTDANTFRADLFTSMPWATALVAEQTGKLIGYALLVRLYRAQYATRVMNLTDLFVASESRGSGIGKELIQAARDEAEAQGCTQLVVATHADNYPAQSFYRKLGFLDTQPRVLKFKLPLTNGVHTGKQASRRP